MRKLKTLGLLAAAGLATVSFASCKGEKGYWNYDDCEFLDENVSVSATTQGTAKSFVASSYEDREEILGLLEKYALENNLTGLVLYDDGGYAKYSSRIKFPTKEVQAVGWTSKTPVYDYIVGYGFGILSEGEITADLAGAEAQYKRYYHQFESSDPKSLNYMNDKGSVVGDYNPYVSPGYFDVRMNDSKDGYEWYQSLASDANVIEGQARPLPLDSNGNVVSDATLQTMATKYRIYVRTDIQYNTLGKFASKYAGQTVKLEDYVTPWQELFTKANGLARGAENLTGAAALKDMNDYYNASADGFNQEAWDKVGLKSGTDSKGSYLDFEFITPCTPFYASYYLSSSLYAPIPAAFLEDIGGILNWGSFNSDATLTPVDTTLSTGAYVVESWQEDKAFVFKKNDKASTAVLGGADRYKIEGIHVAILAAATSDSEAAYKEFNAGKLDAIAIPQTKLQEELAAGEYIQRTKGSSTTKLNINACTEEQWEYFFGENGTITQTPKSEYWDVEPALSNDDFILGLNYALDRQEYATNHGVTPTLNYFSDNYLSDPENGVSYNSTDTHKRVMEEIYGEGWDQYNYTENFDKAIEYFNKAATELLNSGAYKAGDKITIEIAWQAASQVDQHGAEIKQFLETAFNDPAVCNNQLTLEITNMAVAVWSDVYYKKMKVGQFDIGFGGISGNTLNPLNFMGVLKSDNSSGFTLNWSINTNDPNEELITYQGEQYTFDALFQAADTGALVANDGSLGTVADAALMQNTRNEDGSRTVKIKVASSNIANVVATDIAAVILCWYDGPEYQEQEVEYTLNNGVLEITVSKELAETYQGTVSFDVIFGVDYTHLDTSSQQLVSVYSVFPSWIEG